MTECSHACGWHFTSLWKAQLHGAANYSFTYRGRTDMPSPPSTDGSGKAGSKTPYESMLNREVYETFPDQSGIFPEHSINVSTHITSSSALTFLNMALLNNAAINYEITSLICLHASNCTIVKFCNLKTLLKIWVPYPLVPRVPSWHAGHLKATSDFYMTYNKDPKTFLREILHAFWCCNKKKSPKGAESSLKIRFLRPDLTPGWPTVPDHLRLRDFSGWEYS